MDGSVGVDDGSSCRPRVAFADVRLGSLCACAGDRNRHACGVGAGTIASCFVGLRVGIVVSVGS